MKYVFLCVWLCVRNINELLSTAEARGSKFEAKQTAAAEGELLSDRSAKAYYKEFKKVMRNIL